MAQAYQQGNCCAFAMTTEPRNPLVLGKKGLVYKWLDEGGFKKEIIDTSKNGPQHFGTLEDMKVIDNTFYAVGMARCVYKRNVKSKWTAVDTAIRDHKNTDAGFLSIDGYSEKEIYAVGFDGEIFNYDGQKWMQIESPVKTILYNVVCAPDSTVYICGQNGVLLRGNKENWEIIDHKVFTDTIWSIVYFKGSLYCATSKGVFRLEDDKLITVPVVLKSGKAPKTKPNVCYYRLAANADRLWSMGAKMVVWSEDGVVWNEVHYEKSKK